MRVLVPFDRRYGPPAGASRVVPGLDRHRPVGTMSQGDEAPRAKRPRLSDVMKQLRIQDGAPMIAVQQAEPTTGPVHAPPRPVLPGAHSRGGLASRTPAVLVTRTGGRIPAPASSESSAEVLVRAPPTPPVSTQPPYLTARYAPAGFGAQGV